MLEIIDLTQQLDKDTYRREVDRYQTWMRMLGYRLYHEKRPAVIVFEGWDAAGKGGAINRLIERLDPREFVVHPIGAPRAAVLIAGGTGIICGASGGGCPSAATSPSLTAVGTAA